MRFELPVWTWGGVFAKSLSLKFPGSTSILGIRDVGHSANCTLWSGFTVCGADLCRGGCQQQKWARVFARSQAAEHVAGFQYAASE